MLPTVMMEPLGAPQAARAWATACVTKKEPWERRRGEGGGDANLWCELRGNFKFTA